MVGRLTSYIMGIVLVGVGINLLIIANVGLDPWGLFNIAISTSLGITLGSFYIYSGIFFVIINSIIQRKIPDISGMVTSFFMGVSIDIFNLFMSELSIFSSWVEFPIGLIIFCLGLAFYLSTVLPRSPVDDLIFSTQRIINKSFKTSKITLDCIVLVFGMLLGGVLGFGTLLMVVCVGPLIALFTRLLDRTVKINMLFQSRPTYKLKK